MSEFDYIVKGIISVLLPFVLCLYLLLRYIPKVIEYYVDSLHAEYYDCLNVHRNKLLENIKTKEANVVNILELRLNQGENLKFYPSSGELSLFTETEEQAIQAIKSNKCKFVKVSPNPSNLKEFDDGEIDIVVGTSVLCRSTEQTKLLDEIHRVLAPNGKYYFIEHTIDKRCNIIRNIAREFLSVLHRLCHIDLCDMNNNAKQIIESSKFKTIEYTNISIDTTSIILNLIKEHIIGVAMK